MYSTNMYRSASSIILKHLFRSQKYHFRYFNWNLGYLFYISWIDTPFRILKGGTLISMEIHLS